MKKAETKKVTTTKPVAKKSSTTAKKSAATKTAKVEKTTVAAKDKPAKKAAPAKKALQAKIVLQYGEISIDQETLTANVRNYLQYDRNMAVSDQVGVEVYVKPEEGRAYIVVNGVEEGSMLL